MLDFLPLDILPYTSNSPMSNCNISKIKTHSEYRLYNNFFNLATIFSSQFYSKLHTYILFNIMQSGVHHNLPKHTQNHKWSFIFTVLNILYTDISDPGDTPLSCEHPLFSGRQPFELATVAHVVHLGGSLLTVHCSSHVTSPCPL